MLSHRLRRGTKIKSTLAKRLLFAGYCLQNNRNYFTLGHIYFGKYAAHVFVDFTVNFLEILHRLFSSHIQRGTWRNS